MIIEISDDSSMVKWKMNDNEDWKSAEISDLIKAYERPQGEWVRKEDIINYIATQYSKHNELVPIWLSIGNLKGGADMRKGDLL